MDQKNHRPPSMCQKKIAGLVGIGGSPWGHKSFYTQGTEKKKPLRLRVGVKKKTAAVTIEGG